MTSDKSLTTAVLVSAVLHILIICPLAYLKSVNKEAVSAEIKVIYLPREDTCPFSPPIEASTHPNLPNTVKETANTITPVEAPPVPETKQPPSPESKEQNAKIEIPPEISKEDKQLYVDYYQTIREQIRKYVLRNYTHYIDCGEVCLFFILSSEGGLKEINVLDARSSQDINLREIARRSLLQAAPFLPFPNGLEQPQLSFNVTISFETE
ncbi:MAG: hypothetical protein V1662_03915 [Candidatus Omnitrophota bacterium]